MTEVQTDTQPQAESERAQQLPPDAHLRLGRILLVIFPLGIATLAGAIVWGYYDVGARISQWMSPPLVPVSGRVYLNGEPLAGGQVFARSLDRANCNALGKTDAQGNFTLRTDVRGDFLPGVYVGQHRIIIIKPDPDVPPGPYKPPVITPPECADFDNSPLRMKVERDPAQNKMEFRLEYKKPEQDRSGRPSAGGSGALRRPAPSAAIRPETTWSAAWNTARNPHRWVASLAAS